MKAIGVISIVGALAVGAAWASNITIFDGIAGNGSTPPWKGSVGANSGNEDNETEPRTYTGDLWDLEAFLLDGNRLSIVATYDLKNGVPAHNVRSGDIFFDTVGGLGGWEYVIHVDWSAGSYRVYANPDPTRLLVPTDVLASSPFAYNPQANEPTITSGIFHYGQDNSLGFLSASAGAIHNVATFDISFLGGAEFTAHFTMSCGNDLLRGHGQGLPPTPSPMPDSGSTLSLMSLVLLGALGLRRRLAPASMRA